MKIAVIIVNYNAGDALQAAVKSTTCSALINRVVVVDNASRDASLAPLQALAAQMPHLEVQRNARNLGFAVACNQPLASSGQPFLLYLNPDCVLQPGALEIMLQALLDDPKVAMVGPMLRYPDGREQEGGRRAAPTPWRSFVRASGLYRLSRWFPRLLPDFVLTGAPQLRGEVDAVSGACMLVRRSAIDAVGGFDEDYFLHCEDLDWCMRFRLAGWKILFVPEASVIHAKGVCSAPRPLFVAWHKHQGMVRFYRKFYAPRHIPPLRWAMIAGVWLHFCVKLPRALLGALWR